MITVEKIQSCEKENLPNLVPALDEQDIQLLVDSLSDTDDNFRYKCFLLLQEKSAESGAVYPHWETFVEKLGCTTNSYQRSLGLMLIAENVRWDKESRFDPISDRYLSFCEDEKPITARQCIQGLNKIIPYNHTCHTQVVDKLISIDLMQRKETMRKPLLIDVLTVLAAINRINPDPRIGAYIQNALTGEILDSKAKRLIASL